MAPRWPRSASPAVLVAAAALCVAVRRCRSTGSAITLQPPGTGLSSHLLRVVDENSGAGPEAALEQPASPAGGARRPFRRRAVAELPAHPAQFPTASAQEHGEARYTCEGGAGSGASASKVSDLCAKRCAKVSHCIGFLYSDSTRACLLVNASSAANPGGGKGDWTYCRHACGVFENAPACESTPHCMWVYHGHALPDDRCTDRRPGAAGGKSLLQQLAVPLAGLLVGFLFYRWTAGKLLINFGSQALMNLLAKSILSEQIVSESNPRLEGLPTPFLLTGMQQVIAMLIFGVIKGLGKTGHVSYVPKPLTSFRECLGIGIFGLAFGMNMSFNNLSLSLLPLSVNLMIRSCLPLFVYFTQQLFTKFVSRKDLDFNVGELVTMLIGVGCACVVVVASSSVVGQVTSTFLVGVGCGLLSLLSAALNLVLAGVLGNYGLNAVDSAGYMAFPVFLFCVVPFFFLEHPINHWYTDEGLPYTNAHTDLYLLKVVLDKGPSVLGAAVAFGPVTFVFNILQFWLIQSFSATHMSFAGNFNKAATILLAMIIGWERFPSGPLFAAGGEFVGWDWLKAAGILGNVAAFAAFIRIREANMARDKDVPAKRLSSYDDMSFTSSLTLSPKLSPKDTPRIQGASGEIEVEQFRLDHDQDDQARPAWPGKSIRLGAIGLHSAKIYEQEE